MGTLLWFSKTPVPATKSSYIVIKRWTVERGNWKGTEKALGVDQSSGMDG